MPLLPNSSSDSTRDKAATPSDTACEQLPRTVVLASRPYLLRPLGDGDEERLIEFFNSHTEATIRQRYGYLITRMSPARAHRLATPNQAREFALGLFEGAGSEQRLYAVGRWLLDADGCGAELAFAVRETHRRRGLATELFLTLRAVARRRGLEHLRAVVQRDNQPMLILFRKYGARFHFLPETDSVEVSLPLD